MTRPENRPSTLAYIVLLLCHCGLALAQTGIESTQSADEVARELANPNTTLASLSFPIDFTSYTGSLPGADDQSAFRISFQPSFPYPLSDTTNFFLRPLIPIFFDQPVPIVGGEAVATTGHSDFGSTGLQLGDISFDAAIGKSFPNGFLVIGGIVGTLPTATDDRVGLDQYLLGPELMLARVAKWGALGLLVTHQWNVAGEDSFDTSITGGQYFYTLNLKNAWQIQAQPTFSYSHEGASDNRWTLPVGIGMAKTTVFGKTPWKFGLQYWHYLEHPDAFGPDFQVRFSITPVLPLPW